MDGQGRLHWKRWHLKKDLKIQKGWGMKRWGQKWRCREGRTDHGGQCVAFGFYSKRMGRFWAEEWKYLLFFFEGSLWLSRLRIDFRGGRRPLWSRKPVNRLLLSRRQKGEDGMNQGDSRGSKRWSGFKGRNDRVHWWVGCGLWNEEHSTIGLAELDLVQMPFSEVGKSRETAGFGGKENQVFSFERLNVKCLWEWNEVEMKRRQLYVWDLERRHVIATNAMKND